MDEREEREREREREKMKKERERYIIGKIVSFSSAESDCIVDRLRLPKSTFQVLQTACMQFYLSKVDKMPASERDNNKIVSGPSRRSLCTIHRKHERCDCLNQRASKLRLNRARSNLFKQRTTTHNFCSVIAKHFQSTLNCRLLETTIMVKQSSDSSYETSLI